MKKLFQQLGFTADDLAILLYTSVQTIYSWMRRNASIPQDYQQYLNALENCASTATEAQLEQVMPSESTPGRFYNADQSNCASIAK